MRLAKGGGERIADYLPQVVLFHFHNYNVPLSLVSTVRDTVAVGLATPPPPGPILRSEVLLLLVSLGFLLSMCLARYEETDVKPSSIEVVVWK